jgi:glycosyltransferase involved in cell wall biosynthesis
MARTEGDTSEHGSYRKRTVNFSLSPERMRIVQLITGSADYGGAQAHVRDLAVGIREYGHECVVVTGPPDGLFSDQLRARGIVVHVLPSLRKALHPLRDLLALFELAAKLRKLKPDLVAAHTAKAGFLGRVVCAILGIPCVFTPHGWSIIDRATGRINHMFKTLERVGGMLGAGVITVCRDERETGRMSGLIAQKKLFCVYNGIPDSPIRRQGGGDDLTVVMVARFHKQKDHATLLRALSRLQGYSWRLKLVGSGPLLESTRQLATSLGVGQRVEFPGECNNTAEILSQSSVFVLSTFYEAFPISILEAMRTALPVVATNVGGIPEAVSDGFNGFLVPPSRDDVMARSLERLFLDPSLRERLGRNGRERFLERFTDRHMIRRTLDVYSQLLNRRIEPTTADTLQIAASKTSPSAVDSSA